MMALMIFTGFDTTKASIYIHISKEIYLYFLIIIFNYIFFLYISALHVAGNDSGSLHKNV